MFVQTVLKSCGRIFMFSEESRMVCLLREKVVIHKRKNVKDLSLF